MINTYLLTYLLADWLTDWLADWLTGWLADWLTDWLTGWLTDWPTFLSFASFWFMGSVTAATSSVSLRYADFQHWNYKKFAMVYCDHPKNLCAHKSSVFNLNFSRCYYFVNMFDTVSSLWRYYLHLHFSMLDALYITLYDFYWDNWNNFKTRSPKTLAVRNSAIQICRSALMITHPSFLIRWFLEH